MLGRQEAAKAEKEQATPGRAPANKRRWTRGCQRGSAAASVVATWCIAFVFMHKTQARGMWTSGMLMSSLELQGWFEKETATCSTHSCCCMCPQLLACRVSRTRWGFGLSLHIAAGSRHDKEAESSFRGTSRESQEETRPSLGLARSESGEL